MANIDEDEPHSADAASTDEREATDFEVLDLPEELLRAIEDLGFEACTRIQKEVLPHSLDGSDIIGKAQTGTGKTAAFLITSITYHIENPEIEPRPAGTPFALVVAPTRELALQITADAEDLTKYCDFKTLALVGGIDYDKQRTMCGQPVDLIVATPGRLLDFCRSGIVNLGRVEQLIIDEADRMLSMGFIPDIKSIISKTPHKDKRQTLLFSATYNEDVIRLAQQWTKNPVKIEIEPDQVAVDTVEQLVYLTESDKKYALLYNLIMQKDFERILVFVNRRDQTRDLEDKLYRNGINTGLLNGEVPQKKRLKTLDDFKKGLIRVLVATDVAGRGIHVDDITHVINYTLPDDPEDYVHRIGRTGRAGAEGISISFACETDSFLIPNIEMLLGTPLKCELPDESLLADPPKPERSGRNKKVVPQARRRR